LKNRVRWLVIGGGMAGQVHVHAIGRIANAQVTGIVSSKPSPVPGLTVFATLDQALACGKADAAIVATPNHTHTSLVETLLAAEIPVLCEKPVGRSAAEASALLDLSERLGVPIGVVLNQRFCAVNRWIRSLIREQKLRVRRITFDAALPSLGGWHAEPGQSGGGILRLLGIHYVDLMRWWLGEPDGLATDMAGSPIDHHARVELQFGGCSGHLTLTARGDQHGGPPRCVIEADGARIELRGPTIVGLEGLDAPAEVDPSYPDQWFGPGHLNLLVEACETLPRMGRFPVSLAAALPSLRLVDDLYALA